VLSIRWSPKAGFSIYVLAFAGLVADGHRVWSAFKEWTNQICQPLLFGLSTH
jgi:hypothetical protein